MSDIEVVPLTAERWADAVTVFGTRGDRRAAGASGSG